MRGGLQQALDCIAAAASELPAATIEWFASELEAVPDGRLTGPRLERLIRRCQGASHRRQLQQLMRCVGAAAIELPPAAIAWALRGAGARDARESETDRVELVWTGPETKVVKPRESFGALIEVIDSSREQLTIASFAAYKVEPVVAALRKAVDRGVQVRLIFREPDLAPGHPHAGFLKIPIKSIARKRKPAAGRTRSRLRPGFCEDTG